MGLVFDQVSFDGRTPNLTQIAETVAELTQLPVVVEESDAELKQDLYDQHGHIAFACAAKELLELFSYRSGAVRQLCDDMFDGVDVPIAKHVTGLNEPPGTQTLYLRGAVGLETLMGATRVALEALGGRPRHPLDDETRRYYGRPVSEAELMERLRQLRRQVQRATVLWVLLLPVTLPLFLVGLILSLVMMPWRLWKAWRIAKEAIAKRDHEKMLRSVPDEVEFLATAPEAHEMLDGQTLQEYTQELEGLGFVHVIDYSVRFSGNATLAKRPPGFARLFAHPAHRCFAEVNQVFSKKRGPMRMRVSIGSRLEKEWELSTTGAEFRPLHYVWRRPQSAWSCHPHMSPTELLAEHLRRRQRMMESLGIAVTTELTPDAYFAQARKSNADRKAVMRAKSIETIRAEMAQCKRFPVQEWAGDLPVGCWGSTSGEPVRATP